MEIHVDTATLSREEATGLMQLLATVSGVALVTAEGHGKSEIPSYAKGRPTLADASAQPAAPQPAISESAPPAPLAPPAPAASSQQIPAPPSTAGSNEVPEYDAAGVMWDPDHHASSKATTDKGLWRSRRGGPTADAKPLVTRGPSVPAAPTAATPAMSVPTPPVGTLAPGAPDLSSNGQTVTSGAFPSDLTPPAPSAIAPPVPQAPIAPGGPTATGTVVPTPATLFAGAMKKVNDAQQAGKLSSEDIAGICASLGVTAVRDLFQRPDLIPAFEAMLPA